LKMDRIDGEGQGSRSMHRESWDTQLCEGRKKLKAEKELSRKKRKKGKTSTDYNCKEKQNGGAGNIELFDTVLPFLTNANM
jgi:hypothetical protein